MYSEKLKKSLMLQLATGLIPFFITLILSLSNSTESAFFFAGDIFHSLPKLKSSTFLDLTTFLGVVLYFAPLNGLFFVLYNWQEFKSRLSIVRWTKVLIIAVQLLSFFTLMTYFFIFRDYDLTESERYIYKYITSSEGLLIAYYFILFYVYSIMSAICFLGFILSPCVYFSKKRGG